MDQLSIGQVSGLIAAAIFIVQFFLSVVIPLILLGFLYNDNGESVLNAVTWSVLNKALQSSWWPTILRSESVAGQHVRISINIIVNLSLVMTCLVSITAILTPIGLHDTLSPSTAAILKSFTYRPDASAMGYGTPPRSSLGFSRICGADSKILCPGTNFTMIHNAGRTDVNTTSGYNTSVPSTLMDIYNSGSGMIGKSVSSIGDIQWRTYSAKQEVPIPNGLVDNGSSYLVGSYRQLASFLPGSGITLVEGLIVNTITGGIGFRNHSVPPNSTYGSFWSEDILFIEPETECIDTNLTFDFPISTSFGEQKSVVTYDIVLTDRGGFTDLAPGYQWYHVNNTQADADLKGRAYKAAWLNNALSMMYMNLTNPGLHAGSLSFVNSNIGKTYPVSMLSSSYNSSGSDESLFSFSTNLGAIRTSENYGEYLKIPPGSLYLNKSQYSSGIYPNPYGITLDNFTTPNIMCEGVGGRDLANISNHAVACGLMYGSPRPISGDSNPFRTPRAGENYTQPLYSCASAAKASIKEVTFKYNGSLDLSGLTVISIKDKDYATDEDKPLWGVEDSGMKYRDVLPIWGLVDSSHEGRPNISTLRKEFLYLPGYIEFSEGPFDDYQNLPGVSFHMNAFEAVYSTAVDSSLSSGILDYTGVTNFALYRKWIELSRNAQDAGQIINLIWTDLTANSVVGTRGWASEVSDPSVSSESTLLSSNTVPVFLYERQIRYKITYAIPAFILLGLLLLICLTTLYLLVKKNTGIAKMRMFLNRTSLGRNLIVLLYPDSSSTDTPNKVWMQRDAPKKIVISSRGARIAEAEALAEDDSKSGASATDVTTPLRVDGEEPNDHAVSTVVDRS